MCNNGNLYVVRHANITWKALALKQPPFWYRLIYHWCRKQHNYGLTIPFLIGVQTISPLPFCEQFKIDFDTLIFELTKHQMPERIIFHYCEDLKEYVLSLDDLIYPYAAHLTTVGELCVDDNPYSSFDKLLLQLKDEYKLTISAHFYSKNKITEKWEAYNTSDVAMIKNVLVNYE